MGKSDISVTQREEVVRVVFITPPYRRSSVYAHTPPMLSRLSSATVLRPASRQYLVAMRPDHPAPMTITSYTSCCVFIVATTLVATPPSAFRLRRLSRTRDEAGLRGRNFRGGATWLYGQ